jgi:hypothetical protein
MTHRAFGLSVAALLGIVLTAGLTWSISRLAAQHIGLASQPLYVVHGLAPPPGTRVDQPKPPPTDRGGAGDREPRTGGQSPTTSVHTAIQPAAQATQPLTGAATQLNGASTVPMRSTGGSTSHAPMSSGDGQGASGESGGQRTHAGDD